MTFLHFCARYLVVLLDYC